jgi:transcriptional regulator with XRE-family HTH domain
MDVRPELAELSRTIDMAVLGRRIKAARVAAGLTQTQLATPEASTAYLSRIESGERRPDLRLIVAFAAKAGASLEQLLTGLTRDQQVELRVQVDQAAWDLGHGDAAAALAALRAAAQAIEGAPESEISADIRRLTALAEQATGDLDDAIITLEDVVAGDVTARGWLDAAVTLTELYVVAGDAARAADLGERALAVLEADGLGQGRHALALATSVVRAHQARGDRERALAAARRLGAPDADLALATSYRAASDAALQRNQVHLADTYAATARRLGEAIAERLATARYHAAVGELLLSNEPPDIAGARAALTTATEILAESGGPSNELAAARVTLARAILLDGDPDTALATLGADTDADLDPVVAATRHLLLGEIQRRTHGDEAARTSFTHAADALRGAGSDRAGAQLWFELGAVFDDLGDTDASRDAYRRAAAATGLATMSGQRTPATRA